MAAANKSDDARNPIHANPKSAGGAQPRSDRDNQNPCDGIAKKAPHALGVFGECFAIFNTRFAPPGFDGADDHTRAKQRMDGSDRGY